MGKLMFYCDNSILILLTNYHQSNFIINFVLVTILISYINLKYF